MTSQGISSFSALRRFRGWELLEGWVTLHQAGLKTCKSVPLFLFLDDTFYLRWAAKHLFHILSILCKVLWWFHGKEQVICHLFKVRQSWHPPPKEQICKAMRKGLACKIMQVIVVSHQHSIVLWSCLRKIWSKAEPESSLLNQSRRSFTKLCALVRNPTSRVARSGVRLKLFLRWPCLSGVRTIPKISGRLCRLYLWTLWTTFMPWEDWDLHIPWSGKCQLAGTQHLFSAWTYFNSSWWNRLKQKHLNSLLPIL